MNNGIREKQNELTEDVICNSFLTLLQHKAFDKINVTDICKQANINRGTFYNHFRDINALVDYINSWYVDAIIPYLRATTESEGPTINREKFMEGQMGILTVLRSWPLYSQTLLGEEKGQTVIDRVAEISEQIYIENLRVKGIEGDITEHLYRFTFGFYGGWGIIRRWCRSGLKEAPEKIADCILELQR